MDKKVIPTKLSSILKCKCPTCRTGEVFTDPATSWNNYNKMHEYCPVCGLRYELEIGFFLLFCHISTNISFNKKNFYKI